MRRAPSLTTIVKLHLFTFPGIITDPSKLILSLLSAACSRDCGIVGAPGAGAPGTPAITTQIEKTFSTHIFVRLIDSRKNGTPQ